MNSSLPSTHLILFFLFLLPSFSKAQTGGGIVTPGASLTAKNGNSSWTSRSGDFAFGFQPLDNNSDLFLLSIWYNQIPETTIVWYANGDKPAPEGSKVELNSDKGLVLTTPQGDEIWKSQTITVPVLQGVMGDTGNFVLLDANSRSSWESFKNPTDTLLPSQVLERNGFLSSKKSKTNFSSGKFQFRLLDDGNVVMNTVRLPGNNPNDVYYSSYTTGVGKVLEFNESGYLYVQKEDGELVYLSGVVPPSVTEFYLRATIDYDGIFAVYTYPRASKERAPWNLILSLPPNMCSMMQVSEGPGVCGFNGICQYDSDNRPYCGCPKGYSPLDPDDRFSSCTPDFPLSCSDAQTDSLQDLFTFEVLNNTDWRTYDSTVLKPFSEDDCRTSCLQDCTCAVAVHRDGDSCWKHALPLSNGLKGAAIDGKAFVKYPKGGLPPKGPSPPKGGFPPPSNPKFPSLEPSQKDAKSLVTVESVPFIVSSFFNCLLVAAICVGLFLIYWRKPVKISQHENVVETNLRCFTYKELIQATDGFKEELGRGAFGVVYKGLISNTPVAVKKLYNPKQDYEKEFRTELKVIGQTHHKNLVRLIGFCDDGQDKLLVYELLSNGSLSGLLFGKFKPSWKQRCQIASDVARGLLYLHEECSTSIIHCDIKPANILLDDYFTAKISDLGLAKLLQINQSFTDTAIRGTKGYVAPEWFIDSLVTAKVDVYSFGVLLLEIVCCRKSVNGSGEEGVILTDLAYDCFIDGRLDALVEGDLEALHDMDKLSKMVKIALWCIQEEPSVRPSMRKITQMLEGILEVPLPPCPFLFTRTKTNELINSDA